MAYFIVAPQARLDINEIWERISEENPFAADKWVDEMEEKFQKLAETPMMGRARPELASDLRSFPIGNYLICYRPMSNGIEVARVLYGGRNLPALFH
jgi:toxin ParE1/3/4